MLAAPSCRAARVEVIHHVPDFTEKDRNIVGRCGNCLAFERALSSRIKAKYNRLSKVSIVETAVVQLFTNWCQICRPSSKDRKLLVLDYIAT